MKNNEQTKHQIIDDETNNNLKSQRKEKKLPSSLLQYA